MRKSLKKKEFYFTKKREKINLRLRRSKVSIFHILLKYSEYDWVGGAKLRLAPPPCAIYPRYASAYKYSLPFPRSLSIVLLKEEELGHN